VAADLGGPAWLADTFAAVMIVTAGYCAYRLVAARRWHRPTEIDVDVMHAIMGVAMAGMLVPRFNLLRYGSWEIVFGAAMGWFGWQILGAWRGRLANGRPPTPSHPEALVHQHPPDHQPIPSHPHAPGHSLTGEHGPASGPRTRDFGHPHRAHHVPHLLACGAMLYMYLATRPGAGMPGMPVDGPVSGAGHSPGLALPLALALFGYVVWTTDRLTAIPPVAAPAGQVAAWPVNASSLPTRPRQAPRLPVRSRLARAAQLTRAAPPTTGAPPTRAGEPAPAGQPAPATPLAKPTQPPMSPRLAACCEIAMGVTMGYMLIQML
jgi:hypothetical protein